MVGTSMMDTRQRATTAARTAAASTPIPTPPPTPAPPAPSSPTPPAPTTPAAAAAPTAAAATTTNGRCRGSSDGGEGGGGEGMFQAMMEVAQELAERSQIPGVGEAAALVLILVNLVADSRSNSKGADTRVKQCRSIIRLLQRAEKVIGKGGDPTRKESESEMVEDVHEAVADLVQILKSYQSRNRVSQVLMSTLFKRRQEEAEAVIDRAIWRLNLNLHVEVGQKLHEVGENVKEGLRLQAARASQIGDFGTSKWVQHTNSTGLATYTTSEIQGAKMSLPWAAPEVLETKGNSYASDVYSFGIVTWEVITRQLPWADQPLARDIFLRVVMKGERPVIPADCPPGIAQVIRACWAEIPADRPTFHELMSGMKTIG